MVNEFNTRVPPSHRGPLFVGEGLGGCGFTVTVVVIGNDVQLFLLAVTVYTPDCPGIEPAINGFCTVALNPSGPLHAHVTPDESDVANSFMVSPWHIGVLLLAVTIGAPGSRNVTGTIVSDGQLLSDTVICEYTPAVKPFINTCPAPFDNIGQVACVTPFFL